VRSPKGTNTVTKLPHGTSLFELQEALSPSSRRTEEDGLRLSAPSGVFASEEYLWCRVKRRGISVGTLSLGALLHKIAFREVREGGRHENVEPTEL
jgi:hypothetical protein